MDKINVFHGIYDIIFDTPYHIEGFFHKESRKYMPMSNKLKTYLSIKGLKFNGRLGVTHLYFTLARDPNGKIEAIGVCHPKYDAFRFETGEDVAVGRIKRMRGDIKETIYEKEEFDTQMKLYDIKDKNGKILKTIYKTITRKRVKTDLAGTPLIKRVAYFKPYNLDKRYRIKHRDGTTTAGELMYPYVYTMVE